MTCSYCSSPLHADDHRCGRCGRRLSDETVRRPQSFPFQHGSAAPVVETVELPPALPERPGPRIVREPLPKQAGPGAPANRPAQPSLFGPMQVANTQTPQNRRPEQTPAPAPRRRGEPTAQTMFDFRPLDGLRQTAGSTTGRLYSGVAVAPAGPRMTAAAIDVMIPLAGFAMFATSFHLIAGTPPAEVDTTPFYSASAVLILLFYRILCCTAGIDTPGLQFAGLRVLNADGRPPGRQARFLRLGGGLISLLPAGLGLLWSLFDEERLAWHDHISGTFPTQR